MADILSDFAEAIYSGECSGFYELIESDGVDANFMAGLLSEQTNDPAFLLVEPTASQNAPETPEGRPMPEGA